MEKYTYSSFNVFGSAQSLYTEVIIHLIHVKYCYLNIFEKLSMEYACASNAYSGDRENQTFRYILWKNN